MDQVPQEPKVMIVILTWNGFSNTIECLESIRKIKYHNFSITIIDNGSEDNTVTKVKSLYPEVAIVENGSNYGYAKGNNIGFDLAFHSGCDYVLILNNDITVDESFLSELVNQSTRVASPGIIGPTILFAGTEDQVQSIGGIWTRNSSISQVNIQDGKLNGNLEVDFLIGCALLVSRTTYELIGGFDERFFAYWEDTDLCKRAQEAGLRNYCIRSSFVWHKLSGSTNHGSHPVGYYFMARNRALFVQKHGLLERKFWIYKWMLNDIKTVVRSTFWLKWTTVISILSGVFDNCRYHYGEPPKWLLAKKEKFLEFKLNKFIEKQKIKLRSYFRPNDARI